MKFVSVSILVVAVLGLLAHVGGLYVVVTAVRQVLR